MTTLKQLRERRNKGIAFLNYEYPEWLELIDKDRLDMANSSNCVAGQLTGIDYDWAIKEMGIDRGKAFEYAFYTGKDWLQDYENDEEFERDYAKLTRVWKEVL